MISNFKLKAPPVKYIVFNMTNSPNVIFFLYPNPSMIDVIASMILKNELANKKKNYYIYFVPTIDYLCM